MPEAQASRSAAGMETIYSDVWDGLLGDDPHRLWHALQIASPPCQSFSLAGKGAGRAALDDVLRAINDGAYRRPERLRVLGAETDDRTALVLTPLAHVFRDRPLWVTWEQVPPVLPVWEACAEVLRGLGYSVWVGILRAEQYGVPQTRRRAVLIARADGTQAAPPTPTHSRYYERDPQRLDVGVPKWVSMAEALGFGGFTAHKVMGRGMVERHGERPGREADEPAFAIRASAGGMEPGGFVLRSNYSSGSSKAEPPEGNKLPRTERDANEPATTITSKAGSMQWVGRDELPAWCATRPATTIVADPRLGGPGRSEFVKGGVSRQNRPGSMKLEPHEAAALQSYPVGFHFAGGLGKQFLQIGNAVPPLMAGAIIDELLAPAALRVENMAEAA